MSTWEPSDLYGTTQGKIEKTAKKQRMGCRRTHAAADLMRFGSLGDSFHQTGFAEQAARPEQEHHRHEDEDDDLGELGREERRQPHHLADEESGDDGAEQAAHDA